MCLILTMKEQLFIYFFAAFLKTICCDLGPVVYTDKGPVRGVVDKTVWNKTYYSFWGIPYAKPPLNNLRFMPPEELEDWNVIKNTTIVKPKCIQLSKIGQDPEDEDCLYLNVFTPNLPTQSNTDKTLFPVMIWIHGGSFNYGTGFTTDQYPDFFMEENVIWVSFNYRLGVFGFLNSRMLNISGNAGMKDQVKVLKWVRTNIHKFGGDSEKVTLIGWSAGSASVHYHLMSPLSQGLFHKAILQSGSTINPWAFTDKSDDIADILCTDLYNETCTPDILQQLQEADVTKFYETNCHEEEIISGIYPYCFVPSIDDEFLTDNPINLVKENLTNQVPIIIGFNSHEGNAYYFQTEELVSLFDHNYILEEFKILVKSFCVSPNMDFSNHSIHNINDAIFNRFNKLRSDWSGKYTQILTECIMFHGISEEVNLLRRYHNLLVKNPDVFFYQFSFKGDFNFVTNRIEPSIPGAAHGDELGYLFRNRTLNSSFYENDSKSLITLKRMVKMWTNFAKIKNPTPEVNELLPVKWLPVTSETQYMFNIDDEMTMMQNFNESVVEFYSQFYDFS